MAKMITVICEDCKTKFKEPKTWHGQSEICLKCAKNRTIKNNCVRHGGKHGQDCYLCELEGRF